MAIITSTIEDTIAAVASARGKAAVSVIRVSGAMALDIAQRIVQTKNTVLKGGRVYHGWVVDAGQNPMDEIVLLVFQTPKSYTGEDVVELHCHGGELITQKVLARCIEAGARHATPGEFTLRAFLNGKMDLTQAESVMDLISSRSERLLQQASDNIKNRSLGQYIDSMGQGLLLLQAEMVASIDFPDEVEEPDRAHIASQLENCLNQVKDLRQRSAQSQVIREGVKIAILGMPNSGKSSLFNRLLATERSIVTEEAGTTRDVVTETIDIDGISVTLIDTAGIRETRNSIEVMGIERSWKAASEAQIVLYLIDASIGVLRYDSQILSKLDPASTLIVGNKQDLMQDTQKRYPGWIYLSVKTSEGFEALYNTLRERVRGFSPEEAGVTMALNHRQMKCCEDVEEKLRQVQEALNSRLPLDVVTLSLTEALQKLDELQGRNSMEDVLTQVFSRFCVGK